MNRPTAIGILSACVLTGLFLLAAPSANATGLVFDSITGNIVGSYVETDRRTVEEFLNVRDTSKGTVTTKAGNAVVTAERVVPKSSIAKAAGKIAAKAIPGVGTAAAIVELCALLCPGGDYRTSPDGASIQQREKPGVPGDAPGTGYRVQVSGLPTGKSPGEACGKVGSVGQYDKYVSRLSGNNCVVDQVRLSDGHTTQFASYSITKVANWYVPDYVLPTEVGTEADVAARAEQQGKFKPLYDAIAADRAANPTTWPSDYNPLKPTTPVVVSGAPVSSPERVISTTTRTLPDGSTDTTTSTEKTVANPTTSGGTVADSQTTFPTQTVTKNTTINNVTNNTTTETTTVNHPAETTPTTPGETDNSPRECGTPGRPKCQIDETGTPVAPTAIDETTYDQIKEKNTEILDKITQITPESMNVGNWFPQIATAECEDPQVPNPITGEMKSVPVCKPFNVFKAFISAVIAFFCLIGCVREVQSAMKA
ncbi:hypothetical protein D3C72_66450 [compost metagenome]